MPYDENTMLERLVSQLENYNIKEVIIIVGYLKNLVVDKVKYLLIR